MGKDGAQFVKDVWTEDFKMQSVSVSVKDSVLTLFPALKIEANMPTVRILPALNTVEEGYKKMVSKGRDLELSHQMILAKYPARLSINENFEELAATEFAPNFR